MTMRVTIGARKGNSLGSALIRAAQGWRSWSHTADLLPDLRTTVECLALDGGVVTRTLHDLHARSGDWIALAWQCDADKAAETDRWLRQQEGKGYDWGGAVGTAWAQMRDWQDPERWYCSELSAMRAHLAGALPLSPYIRGVMPTACVDLLIAAGAVMLDRDALLDGEVVPQ